MSLVLAKPQRISSDIIYRYDLINENDTNSSFRYAEVIFDSKFIKELLEKLFSIDKEMKDNYGDEGLAWFGKDTTLNGIFAGIGVYLELDNDLEADNPKSKILNSFDKLKKVLPENLNLKNFNAQYDSLSGRSVNIGNLIRTVVMNYTIHSLEEDKVTWKSLFNKEMNR